MFEFQGIWFPDGEKHFPEWMAKNGELVDGRGTYQIKKWRLCMPWIRNWRIAVDVGAHVGLWSMQLQKKFETVRAFEPVHDFRECFRKNAGFGDWVGACNRCHSRDEGGEHFIRLDGIAIGDRMGDVSMVVNPADTGGTHVGGTGDIILRPLDIFGFSHVDFLKIDCEGYEHHVIEGARETLLRCKPCVIVEQKQHILKKNFGIDGTPAVDALKALGAVLRTETGGDYILSWDS